MEGSSCLEIVIKSNWFCKLKLTVSSSLHLPILLQINISQKEYEEKYRLYLERLNGRSRNSRGMMSSPYAAEDADDNEETDDETDLHIMHTFRPSEYPHKHLTYKVDACPTENADLIAFVKRMMMMVILGEQ